MLRVRAVWCHRHDFIDRFWYGRQFAPFSVRSTCRSQIVRAATVRTVAADVLYLHRQRHHNVGVVAWAPFPIRPQSSRYSVTAASIRKVFAGLTGTGIVARYGGLPFKRRRVNVIGETAFITRTFRGTDAVWTTPVFARQALLARNEVATEEIISGGCGGAVWATAKFGRGARLY